MNVRRALRIAFCCLIRLTSLLEVNHRFCLTIGNIRASETDLRNPFDNLGVLEFPDLSVNNKVIIANGWLDLTELQNSIN